MRLWIDDVCPTSKGYWVESINERKIYYCQHLLPNHILKIDEFHFDHDASNYIEFLKWLEQKHCRNHLDINGIFKFHSMNSVEVQKIRAIIQKNGCKGANK